MDQATEVALIESGARLLRALRDEADSGTKVTGDTEAAAEEFQRVVDHASAQTPLADATGEPLAAPNGSDTTSRSSAEQTVDATAGSATTPA